MMYTLQLLASGLLRGGKCDHKQFSASAGHIANLHTTLHGGGAETAAKPQHQHRELSRPAGGDELTDRELTATEMDCGYRD